VRLSGDFLIALVIESLGEAPWRLSPRAASIRDDPDLLMVRDARKREEKVSARKGICDCL
jgi:hypothetical protein